MLRDYQKELADKGTEILKSKKIVYFAMEIRTGKTLTALQCVENLKLNNALFVTKKKAIASIEDDFKREGFKYSLEVINYEQLHNVDARTKYQIVIVDEAHSIGAFPNPSERTKFLRGIVGSKYLILLSGTPTPESYSQIYHQFWISGYSPFFHYKNFYVWAKYNVNVQTKNIGDRTIRDYKQAYEDRIKKVINPYMLTFSQNDAGFKQSGVIENIIKVKMHPGIRKLTKYLLKHKYYKFQNHDGEIECDTPVKLQNKIHQLSSGTIKTESGDYLILDKSKAEYIKDKYQGKRIAVFYKFIAEGKALKEVFENSTDSPEKFNAGEYDIFISQVQSGSMGVNLSTADYLLFYNIDFSATQYWQARGRLQTLSREKPAIVHWIFSEGGIEEKVYQAVIDKKDYTLGYFRRDYRLIG